MSYQDFLKALIALGPKLPTVWAEIEKMIAAVKAIAGIVQPAAAAAGALELNEISPDEAEAEAAVACILAGPNAAFDGAILRGLYGFAKANPWLLDALLALLKGG